MDDRPHPPSISFVRPDLAPRRGTIAADPHEVEVDFARTALVVVDMQNDFLHSDGWFPQKGIDPSPVRKIIPLLAQFTDDLRRAGLPIIWLNWGVRADAANLPHAILSKVGLGGAQSVYGDVAPSGRGRILVEGDWGAANIDELRPQAGDIVVHKHRLSGFWDNEFDAVLRKRGIDTLLFSGINTDRCVFSTLTDASFLGYGCVLVKDACATPSPDYVRDAVLYLVHLLYGVSATSAAVLAAANGSPATYETLQQGLIA